MTTERGKGFEKASLESLSHKVVLQIWTECSASFRRGVYGTGSEEAAKLYSEKKVTLARAAEEAGVSLWEMMDYVRQRKIPAQYSLEDLEHDLKVIYKRVGQKPWRFRGRKLFIPRTGF